MLYCIWQELKKLLFWPFTVISVAGSFLLCLTSTATVNDAGKEITILSLIAENILESKMNEIDLSNLVLWNRGIGEWMALLLPLVLTFGYIVIYTEERKNGQIMFSVIRSGNASYCISKVVSGVLYGGSTFLMGYMLFGILLSAVFPPFFGFSVDMQMEYFEIYDMGRVMYVLSHLLGAFLFGACSSVWGIAMVIFFQDRHMLLCLPFLFNYMYRQIVGHVFTNMIRQGGNTAWVEALYPELLVSDFFHKMRVVFLVLMLLVYISLMVTLLLKMKKRGGVINEKY